jgi:hypothetical protein
MTQQEPGSERGNRLAALKSQISTRGGQSAPTTEIREEPPVQQGSKALVPAAPRAQPEQSTEAEISEQKSERKRHTLYYSTPLNDRVDDAFKQVAHDIFPLEIEKADFLEACFVYCLENLGDIRVLLQQPLNE